VSDTGDLFFKTTPIVNWPPGADLVFPIEFKSINPKTAELSSLYKYDIESKYGSATTFQKIIIDEKDYGVIAGNFISSVLIEGEIENDFYFTDSMLGEFESLLQTLAPKP